MEAFQKIKPLLVQHQFSGFWFNGSPRGFYSSLRKFSISTNHDTKERSLSDMLRARVEVRGPLTVADYMRSVLISPGTGYYMNRDVFGSKGDFITSPEISQLFGEMVGVWCVNETQKFNISLPQTQLIELGPGRGTLMRDVLRVFSALKATEGLSLHMVEISPELSKIQAQLLCPESSVKIIEENIVGRKQAKISRAAVTSNDIASEGKAGLNRGSVNISAVTVRRPPGVDKENGFDASHFYYMKGTTHEGLPIFWYRSLLDVPRGFSCIFAHEFFDALPIHKFQRTEHGWREMLIVPDPEAGKECFKYALARSETPASKLLMKDNDKREQAEVCLEAALLMRHIERRLEEDGGMTLIADYGHEGDETDTFRAFSKHKQTNPLVSPGKADLTADVDFSYLKNNLGKDILTLGPIMQSEFLRNMGIETRLRVLLGNSEESHHAQLVSGYKMITSPESMGSRFKFFALFPAVYQNILKQHPVAGFSNMIDNVSNKNSDG